MVLIGISPILCIEKDLFFISGFSYYQFLLYYLSLLTSRDTLFFREEEHILFPQSDEQHARALRPRLHLSSSHRILATARVT